MAKKKTWTEKLVAKHKPYVKLLEKKFSDMPEGTNMLIANPMAVKDYISQIPIGVSVDMKTLRTDLALTHGGDIACPVSTGIFVRIVAESALESHEKGASLEEITPFWRVINSKMPAAKKISCGPSFITTQRSKEGLD